MLRLVLGVVPVAGAFAGAVAILVAALAGATATEARFSEGDWRYVREVRMPAGLDGEGLVELIPDAALFGGAREGLRDVRIIETSSGREVAYSLVADRGARERSETPIVMRDLSMAPDRSVSFTVEVQGDAVLHNGIEILTPATGFQRSVEIAGSDDGASWGVMATRQIYDFRIEERSVAVTDTTVSYPGSSSRYLRVRVENGGDEPLEIEGATLFYEDVTPERRVAYRIQVDGPQGSAEIRSSVFVIDLGTSGPPVDRLTVAATDTSFHRNVTVEVGSDEVTWRRLPVSGALWSFDTPRFTGDGLTVEFPESTARYIRLTVLDEDNPPLRIDGVKVSGIRRRLVFEVRPGERYALYYGNPKAEAPSYDLERFFRFLETQDLPEALMGPEAANGAFRWPEPASEPFTERYPWLVPLVVAIAGVALGLVLLRVIRKAGASIPPPA